jgi:RNA polymerase sigma-70 factor, ECF subfamily
MFEDEIVPGTAAARVSSKAHTRSCPEFSKPSPLEEEVVSLFDQMQDRLLRYLFSIGLPAPDGEEIVQEVFLALFQHLQRGKPRYNLRAWVFQVTHKSGAEAAQPRAAKSTNPVAIWWDLGGELLPGPAPSPEDQLARSQRQVRLHSVLQAVPEQDRQCVALRAEGLTYRERSRVLDMSLGSVSLSLGRSLARFARADER